MDGNCFFACLALATKFACCPYLHRRSNKAAFRRDYQCNIETTNEGKVSLSRWFVQITTIIPFFFPLRTFLTPLDFSSFPCKAAFPNLWWWWKRHPFSLKKLAEGWRTFSPLVALSYLNSDPRGTGRKYNISQSFPNSWLKSRILQGYYNMQDKSHKPYTDSSAFYSITSKSKWR